MLKQYPFKKEDNAKWNLRFAGTFYIFTHPSGVSVVINYYIGDRFVVILEENKEPIFLNFWKRRSVKRFLKNTIKRSRRIQVKDSEYKNYKKELKFIESRPRFYEGFL